MKRKPDRVLRATVHDAPYELKPRRRVVRVRNRGECDPAAARLVDSTLLVAVAVRVRAMIDPRAARAVRDESNDVVLLPGIVPNENPVPRTVVREVVVKVPRVRVLRRGREEASEVGDVGPCETSRAPIAAAQRADRDAILADVAAPVAEPEPGISETTVSAGGTG